MSQRLFTRVAVVQLAYHPAILLANRSPLEDPLGTDDTLRVLDDLPGKLTERLQSLRARIRQTYLGQLRKKIVAVLDFCRRSGVRLVVFPEYAVPWQLLSDVVQASDQMVVVAGTHTVDRESRKSGIYAQLGTANPTLLSAVCPVLYRGRALALQAKLNPAKPEEGQMKPGTTWSPIELPDGLPGPMGALVCLDFLFRESPAHQRLVLPHLNDCRFLVVPSLTPTHTLGEFAAKAWEEARRYGRPVLYCDTAGLADKEGGGTSIFVDEGHPSDLRNFPEQVGYLDRGEEGVIVADIDLGYVRVGESTRYNWERPVRPVAAASLLYGFHPADLRYKSWRKETESLLLAEDDDAVEALSQRVEGDSEIIQNAAAIGGPSRERRLRQLVTGHARLQTIDDFHKRLREVELPDDVLPLPVLRGVMAGAVSDVLFDWQRETRDPKLAELSERLRKASASATKDRAERSDPGTKSIGQVRESVIGTELQRSAPTPTVIHQVRQVLPTGIDPALLGVRQANGLTLRFAASVDDLWMNSLRGLMDEPERIDGSPSTENIKIVAGLPVSEWLPAVGGLAGLKVRTPHAAAPGPKVVSSRSVVCWCAWLRAYVFTARSYPNEPGLVGYPAFAGARRRPQLLCRLVH
jgi:predicted amidohydrolase